MDKIQMNTTDIIDMKQDEVVSAAINNIVDSMTPEEMEILKENILNSDNQYLVTADQNYLRQVSTDATLEEGAEIAKKLFKSLSLYSDEVGATAIAAIQIQIPKNIIAINVKTPFYLVNPKIVGVNGMTGYIEGCLSFGHGVTVKTKRFANVTVTADNIEGTRTFGPDLSQPINYESLDLLEAGSRSLP